MPWNKDSFRKHNKSLSDAKASKAASIANAIVKDGGDEGMAIATANKHVKRQVGGMAPPPMGEEEIDAVFDSRPHEEGLLEGDSPGRTDRLPQSTTADSFVIPADVVSSLGQGNTASGAKILSDMLAPMLGEMGPKQGANGGQNDRSHVIVAAGEFMVPKHKVDEIGRRFREQGLSKARSDNNAGQEYLREVFVPSLRKQQMKFLKEAPQPKR